MDTFIRKSDVVYVIVNSSVVYKVYFYVMIIRFEMYLRHGPINYQCIDDTYYVFY